MNKDEFSLRSEATTDKQTDKFIKEFKLWVGGFFTKNLRHSSYLKWSGYKTATSQNSDCYKTATTTKQRQLQNSDCYKTAKNNII